MGLKNYETEYNRFPLEALTSSDQRAWQRSRGAIMNVLHPDDRTRVTSGLDSNPRKIVCYDPPPAKMGKNGLYSDEHGEPVLVDPWGGPLYFLISFDGSGKVLNPDPRDNKAQPFIETSIIMFSAGPDRNPNTWEDNIMSWK